MKWNPESPSAAACDQFTAKVIPPHVKRVTCNIDVQIRVCGNAIHQKRYAMQHYVTKNLNLRVRPDIHGRIITISCTTRAGHSGKFTHTGSWYPATTTYYGMW